MNAEQAAADVFEVLARNGVPVDEQPSFLVGMAGGVLLKAGWTKADVREAVENALLACFKAHDARRTGAPSS